MILKVFQPTLTATGLPALDFHLLNQQGEAIILSEMLTEGPVVLLFFSDDRWRQDRRMLKQYSEYFSSFKEAGARLLAISARDWEALHHFHHQEQLPFDILFDPACKISTRYGATLIPRFVTGQAVFIVDQTGTIQLSERGFIAPGRVLNRLSLRPNR